LALIYVSNRFHLQVCLALLLTQRAQKYLSISVFARLAEYFVKC